MVHNIVGDTMIDDYLSETHRHVHETLMWLRGGPDTVLYRNIPIQNIQPYHRAALATLDRICNDSMRF